jgi:trigger factor
MTCGGPPPRLRIGSLKTEFTDVTETQKTLTIEIPSDVVDAEINRIAKDYSKQARIPGFRPGKVPSTVVKQRFREQILHDVMHGLIPRAVDEALQERGIEPVDTPNIRDVDVKEGHPLIFTAAIETVPAFDPGSLSTLTVTRPSTTITDEAVEEALQRLRERGAKFEPVEGRPVSDGDTVVLDIARTDAEGGTDRHDDVSIELGAPANPPGFDANLIGLNAGDEKTFAVHFPEEYPVKEMANTDVTYAVKVKELRHKALPELDDEFAKDLKLDSMTALRDQVRADLQEEAGEHATRHVRSEVLKQLSERLNFEPPASLIDREIDRRLEEFARQLMQQRVDPRQAGIDWAQFRESQRDAARVAVASALALDEIARRDNLAVSTDELDAEIEKFALRAGRTPAALRAQLEKEGGVARLSAGLRREKALEHAIAQASIT